MAKAKCPLCKSPVRRKKNMAKFLRELTDLRSRMQVIFISRAQELVREREQVA